MNLLPKEYNLFMESLRFTNCQYCQSNEYTTIITAPDWINKIPGSFNIVKCKKCGFVYTNPQPHPENIDYFYPNSTSYYQPQMPNFVTKRKKIIHHTYSTYLGYPRKNKLMRQSLWPLSLLLKRKIMQDGIPRYKTNGKLLDIGSSYGAFLAEMKYLGWTVKGIEMNEKASLFGRKELGLDIQSIKLENLKAETKYDVITMRMFLEHVYSPNQTLNIVKNLLKADGELIIIVPDINGIERKIFGKYAYTNQVPTHLVHFSPITIKKFLQANGFDKITIKHQTSLNDILIPFNYMIEEGKKVKLLKKVLSLPIIQKLILKPVQELFAFFGKTSRMTIYATLNKTNE
jgi:2-polyprenyl-3-methyl-5-hydroxy-6-metoxy-1,4-benzoquinol methylase